MTLPLHYILSLSGQSLVVREVEGREAINEPFRFALRLHLEEGQHIDPDTAVKAEATLTLQRERVERTVTGVVSEVRLTETKTGAPRLDVVLEPRFALLRHKQNVKAYLHKTVPDIVQEVLSENGIAFTTRLQASYEVRPYTVQMRETDAHFVHRMLEEEGIFFFFDEAGAMVLADSASGYDDGPSLPVLPPAGLDEHRDAVTAFGARSRAVAGQVALRDWNLEAPSAPMDVVAGVAHSRGPELYDFPGEYQQQGTGQRMADGLAEALGAAASGYVGATSAAALAPGRILTITDAPVGITEGGYAVVSVDHAYDLRAGGFLSRFEAVDAEVAKRPLRIHEEPVLPNPVTGFVTGAPGEDIHTDELGRVKVWFPWDRLQGQDDTCSHWIPVLQDNTGHSTSVPRVGWEVLVSFLEGDPDRPVVMGRVFNGRDVFHVKLPERKTLTALRSVSSPGRDGHNKIELEDLAGWEEIGFHAERNEDIVIERDRTERVMDSEAHRIGRDEEIVIGRDEDTKVHARSSRMVKGNETLSIGGDRDEEVGGGHDFSVEGNLRLDIGGSYRRRSGSQVTETANTITESIGALALETSVAGNSTYGGDVYLSLVGGAEVELAGEEKLESASKVGVDVVGGVALSKSKDTMEILCGGGRLTTVGALMKVSAMEQLSLAASEVLEMMTATATHTASTTIVFKVGETKLSLSEGQIELYAPTDITFELEEESNLGSGQSEHI